jgi:hypothetical protein
MKISRPNRPNKPKDSKKEKVFAALKRFQETGEIAIDLLEGFTQHGNWIGIPESNELEPNKAQPNQGLHILEGYILPKEERARRDQDGHIHLLTSYRSLAKGQDIAIDYKTINGNVHAPLCKSFNAPNLETVGAEIDLRGSKNVELPALRKVGGNLHLNRVDNAYLPNLQTVYGTINIYRSKSLTAPKLTSTKFIQLESINMQNKEEVLRNLDTTSLKSFKKYAYTSSTLKFINKELKKRTILKEIQIKGKNKGLSLY